MKKINWTLDIGVVGGKIEGSFLVEDDAPAAEIQELLAEDIWESVYVSWEEENV